MTGASSTPAPFAAARAVRILHGVLTAGVVFITGTFLVLDKVLHRGALLGSVPMIGYGLTLVSIVIVTAAMTVIRPRVPERRREITPDAFWLDAQTRGSALLTWATLESAGIAGAIGYIMTGAPVTLAAISVSLVALAWTRPAQLEQVH